MSKRERASLQRKLGLILVFVCIIMILVCSTGNDFPETDATAALLLFPAGVWMFCTKQLIL